MSDHVSVIVIEVGKEPEIRDIEHTLDAEREIVQGDLDSWNFCQGLGIFCNDMGRIQGLPFNCKLAGYDFFGNILVYAYNSRGETVSVTPKDYKLVCDDWKVWQEKWQEQEPGIGYQDWFINFLEQFEPAPLEFTVPDGYKIGMSDAMRAKVEEETPLYQACLDVAEKLKGLYAGRVISYEPGLGKTKGNEPLNPGATLVIEVNKGVFSSKEIEEEASTRYIVMQQKGPDIATAQELGLFINRVWDEVANTLGIPDLSTADDHLRGYLIGLAKRDYPQFGDDFVQYVVCAAEL